MTIVSIYFLSHDLTTFLGLIIFVVLGIGYVRQKARAGSSSHYFHLNISDKLKKNLAMFHGSSALILAMITPDIYLNKIHFFRELFAQDNAWSIVTSVILIFVFIPAIGEFLSFCVRLILERKSKS